MGAFLSKRELSERLPQTTQRFHRQYRCKWCRTASSIRCRKPSSIAGRRPAAFARRQTGRSIRRKCPTEAVNLTSTQPHQCRSGINREPIIREIDHHPQTGPFPIAHPDHPRHRTSPRTFRRQCASATFRSATRVRFLSGVYTEPSPKRRFC